MTLIKFEVNLKDADSIEAAATLIRKLTGEAPAKAATKPEPATKAKSTTKKKANKIKKAEPDDEPEEITLDDVRALLVKTVKTADDPGQARKDAKEKLIDLDATSVGKLDPANFNDFYFWLQNYDG